MENVRTTVVAVTVVVGATILGALDKLSSDALQGIYYVVLGGTAAIAGVRTQQRRGRGGS